MFRGEKSDKQKMLVSEDCPYQCRTEPGLWIAHACFNVKRIAGFGDSFVFRGEKSDKQKMLVSEDCPYQCRRIKVGVYFKCIIGNKPNLNLIALK